MTDATLASQLRAAIAADGRSQYQLAKDSGVPQQRINDFANGKDMGLRNAGNLAAALGIRLTRPAKRASARTG